MSLYLSLFVLHWNSQIVSSAGTISWAVICYSSSSNNTKYELKLCCEITKKKVITLFCFLCCHSVLAGSAGLFFEDSISLVALFTPPEFTKARWNMNAKEGNWRAHARTQAHTGPFVNLSCVQTCYMDWALSGCVSSQQWPAVFVSVEKLMEGEQDVSITKGHINRSAVQLHIHYGTWKSHDSQHHWSECVSGRMWIRYVGACVLAAGLFSRLLWCWRPFFNFFFKYKVLLESVLFCVFEVYQTLLEDTANQWFSIFFELLNTHTCICTYLWRFQFMSH